MLFKYAFCLGSTPDGYETFSESPCDSGFRVGEVLIFIANLSMDLDAVEKLEHAVDAVFSISNVTDENTFDLLSDLICETIGEDLGRILSSVIYWSVQEKRKKTGCKEGKTQAEATVLISNLSLARVCVDCYINKEPADLFKTLSDFEDIGAIKGAYTPFYGRAGESILVIDAVTPENLRSLIFYGLLDLLRERTPVKKCSICGKFFIPQSRSDEIYCDSCRAISYEQKIQSDAILSAYRKIYKTQNARKHRNQQIRNISERFDRWAQYAKLRVEECKQGHISVEQMVDDISSEDWMREDP